MKSNVDIGDLICYNAGGMRRRTLGIVYREWYDHHKNRYLLIRWSMRGEYLPRSSYKYYQENRSTTAHPDPYFMGPEGDKVEYIWYDDAHYFEVISEDR